MTKVLTIVSGILFVIFSVYMAVLSIQYDRDIGGHLKLAADSNSTDLAERKLKQAIDGMDRWNLCNQGSNCFTSVVYQTPDEDVAFWRENIQNTLNDLTSMSPAERADNLIESNQLLKVRETLLDSGANGDHVTDPPGISRYPANAGYAVWGILSGLMFLLCGCYWFFTYDSRRW